ncbi:MAG: hypothetical protein ABW221_23040 [Vicinamibacteria bacterium]
MRRALPLALLLLPAPLARAQTNDHFFRSWRAGAEPLTARAAGMGGAVLALPDDTAGIEANPANLTSLGKTEVSASLRTTADGDASYPQPSSRPDAFAGGSALASASAAGRIGTRWAVGASYQGTRRTRIELAPRSLPDGLVDEGTLATSFDAVALAAAWHIGPSLHVGARVAGARGSVEGAYRREAAGRAADLRVETSGSATRVAGGVGIAWQAAPAVRLGAAATSGATFSFDREATSPAQNVTLDPGSRYRLRQPAAVGAGACVRVSRHVTALAQLDRVRYGEIRSNLSIRQGAAARTDYALADGWEPRAGVEVSLPFRSVSLQLRGGWHRAAPGALRYAGTDAVEAASFLGAPAHGAFSAGVSLAARSFRLDLAGVAADPGTQVLAGITGRF